MQVYIRLSRKKVAHTTTPMLDQLDRLRVDIDKLGRLVGVEINDAIGLEIDGAEYVDGEAPPRRAAEAEKKIRREWRSPRCPSYDQPHKEPAGGQ